MTGYVLTLSYDHERTDTDGCEGAESELLRSSWSMLSSLTSLGYRLSGLLMHEDTL